jgi:hypothetical protein
MSQYLIMLYEDQAGYASADEAFFGQIMQEHQAFQAEAGARNLGGNALQPPQTATSIRKDDAGGFVITDGPFAETKEALGGYYLIEAGDLDEAIALAKLVPTPFGGIEIRPIMTFE